MTDDVSLPALLRAARRAYGREVRDALEQADFADLPRNGPYVLGALARDGAPLAAIIDALGVSKQAGGALVDTLVARHYLERTVDPDDRRRLHVTLTARGSAAAAVVRKAVARVDRRLVGRVGAQHVAHARIVLTALADDA